MLYRGEMIMMMKQHLVKDLRDIYTFAKTQHEISLSGGTPQACLKAIEEKSMLEFKNRNSLLLGIRQDGSILFQSSRGKRLDAFPDRDAMDLFNKNFRKNVKEGFTTFTLEGKQFFGVYKYNMDWNAYFLRAEEFNEFYARSRVIFTTISLVIGVITLLCAVAGVLILRHVLKYIGQMTQAIIAMTRDKQMGILDLKDAQTDDVTFLGMSFNSLSNTISNLLQIFQKFTNRDIVVKAYEEREIRLEGAKHELTCLFSDIKSFTNMTEVLGTEIITLLNLHYTQVINIILGHDGIIGSIIGDALLAVYGVFPGDSARQKSYQAVITGYQIHDVARQIRSQMIEMRERIIAEKGSLTPEEERVYEAVLIDVGVGIDGGMVFYGNIGSHERMTNTVIGDNVNSASRLEGLNRIYKIPVICSEYIKLDIERNVPETKLKFTEIDTVRVKGKTEGKKIYWPIPKENMTKDMQRQLAIFSEGLAWYYAGKWKSARRSFERCTLPMAEVFRTRTASAECPKNWAGIWAMDSK
ncbi:MAG: adenylate/guanylate cyclase domain-containing protein [Spirochaetes bacterium]|nr:adenylate/guanylate cyclase domain-containing protein [Spirochaetota bacterium]